MFGHGRALATAAVCACALLALTGCTSGSAPDDDATPVEPTPTAESDVAAAWLDEGRGIGVVTYGSSSCEPSLDAADIQTDTLTVELSDPADAPCTRDYVPRVTYVPAPEGVDPSADLRIVVEGDYAGEVVLAGDARLTGAPGQPTEYAPSAGWVSEGMIAILTWGSSSCPPVVESAAVTGESEVTVTFETPPEDQVCTMDMAPRATLAAVGVPDEPVGAALVLIGERGDIVEVAIAGAP